MTASERFIQTKILEMVRKIIEKVHPEKIILFGSQARGTAGPDSDVDLMVVMPVLPGTRRKTTVAIYEILGGMGISKDIIVVTPEEVDEYRNIPGTLIYPALQEGKILYD